MSDTAAACKHPARFTDDGTCVECRQPATAAHRSVCQRCGGLGYLVSGNGGPGAQSLRTCLDCDGTGEVTEDA